jgi:hypothetical protein
MESAGEDGLGDAVREMSVREWRMGNGVPKVREENGESLRLGS